MARPFHELLAESLTRVEAVSKEGVVRTEAMSRSDRERLLKGGWLMPVASGWYLLCSPQAKDGESTVWYASFWHFIAQYLNTRFGDDYCLSAESSLDVHVGSTVIPKQLIVISKKGPNQTISLPFETSVIVYQDDKNFPQEVETQHNINVMPTSLALCRVSKTFFEKDPISAEIALSLYTRSQSAHCCFIRIWCADGGEQIGGCISAYWS